MNVITKKQIFDIAFNVLNRSSFYQKTNEAVNIKCFEDFRMISKKDLLDDQKINPPYGSNVCVPKKDLIRIHRTSGTTNKPLILVLTQNDIDNVINSGKNAFITAGLSNEDVVFNCMNYCMWMGGFMDHQSLESTGATVVPYGVGNTENLLALLLDIKNSCIHATPSYLNVLKDVLDKKFDLKPKDLQLKKGFFGGEAGMDNKVFRKKIEDEWGMVAINGNYGMSEAISIMGSECSERVGLHFSALDNLYVELVEPDINSNKLIPIEAGAQGELVVTTINKEAQPLIRYRTGDIIEIVSTDRCKCGSNTFTFNIVGRRDDMIVVRGINFYPEQIRTIISKYSKLTGRYKVIAEKQTPLENFVIEIETQTEISGDEQTEIIQSLLEEIRTKFFVSPKIICVDHFVVEGNKFKLIERVDRYV